LEVVFLRHVVTKEEI